MTKNEVKLNFPLKQGENVELSVTEDGKAIEIAVPNCYTKDEVYNKGEVNSIVAETLQNSKDYTDEKVDELKKNPDVVDIVQTYADLSAYDTSTLGDNDIVRVLVDETQDNKSSFYQWNKSEETWTLIGTIDNGMRFYKVTYSNGTFKHNGESLDYEQLVDKFNDDAFFLYLALDGLVYIPSMETGDALAFSVAWTLKEEIGSGNYDQPYINRVIINSENQIRNEQIGMQSTELLLDSFSNYQEQFSEKMYPNAKAVKEYVDELSDTKLNKVEDLGGSELVYAQQTGVQKMIVAEVTEEPDSLIKRSNNGTAFIQVPTGNDINPLYISNVGYVDSKTVVVNSSSYTTLDDSETTDVPALTVEQVTTIYNAIVAGKKVYVRDNSGDVETLFTDRANVDDILTVSCTYMGKLTLSYSIVGETVQVSYKEIGQGISVVEWGDIGGDIENQANLMEELNKKIEADDSSVVPPIDSPYLKNATVSNGTLTLTKQDNTTVEFENGEDSGYTDIIRTSEELQSLLDRTTTDSQTRRILIKSGLYQLESSTGYLIPRDILSITGETNTVIFITSDSTHMSQPVFYGALRPSISLLDYKFKNLNFIIEGFSSGFDGFKGIGCDFDNVIVKDTTFDTGITQTAIFNNCRNIHNINMSISSNFGSVNFIAGCANVYDCVFYASQFGTESVLLNTTDINNVTVQYDCYERSQAAFANCKGVKNCLVEYKEYSLTTDSGYSSSHSVQTAPSATYLCDDTPNGGFNITIHTQIS